MLYQSVLAAGLVATSFAGPLSSCYDQADCLDLSVTELAELNDAGQVQYEICLIFDDTLGECDKDGAISHACVAGEDAVAEEGDKTEEWGAGTDGALCDIVPCGSHTSFGVKDGRSCEVDQFLYVNLTSYDQMIYCYDGFSCGSKKQSKACEWLVLSPECEANATTQIPEDPDTTAADEEPASTAADEPATTAADECVDIRVEDCMECGFESNEARDCCNALACCSWAGGACLLPPSDGDAVYVRSPKTDGNMNEDLVIPDEILEEDAANSLVTEAPGSEEKSGGNMVKFGFGAVMAIFAYLF